MKYLIIGGKAKENAVNVEAQFAFEEGRVLLYDSVQNHVDVVINHTTPKEFLPESGYSISFRSASIFEGGLIVCTQTEVIIYDLNDFKQKLAFSHKYFNDLHHVDVFENEIYVVSTGIDAVLVFDMQGRFLRYVNLSSSYDARNRFGDIDFRKIPSTKPHTLHPNFITFYGNKKMATCFKSSGVVDLDTGDEIKVSERMHDGHVVGDKMYYTRVDGTIFIKNKGLLNSISLTEFDLTSKHLGWCRSLYVNNSNSLVVGFTRLRPTKEIINVNWIKNFRKNLRASMCKPTRIVAFELGTKSIDWELNVEPYGLNSIFSILKV